MAKQQFYLVLLYLSASWSLGYRILFLYSARRFYVVVCF